ncbi:MAG: vanadium-dependent haloperoxidase, partial [Bryobacteraceae bacterium]
NISIQVPVHGARKGKIFFHKLSPTIKAVYATLPLLTEIAPAQTTNPIIEWNRTLLTLVRTPNLQPATVHSTRSFAMMHLAMEEAVRSVDGAGSNTEVLQKVAAVAAAHQVLVALYPSVQSNLDQTYQASLATVVAFPKVGRFLEAIKTGSRAADRVIRDRANDGSNVSPPIYSFGMNPGDYQSTPPNFPKQPQFVHWRDVTPFSLHRAGQFRPGPPPALNSATYVRGLNEVQMLGATVNSSASPEQMTIGRFWNGSIQNYWNEIAQIVAIGQGLNTADTARVFALLNIAIADSVIAFYDAKYQYSFWRPVTAIRAADPNITPGSIQDPQWLPEVTNTAPDPSYPGAHAVISSAAAEVLVAALETDWVSMDVTSEVMSGVTRHFDTISDAEAEATRSRVYAGAHFTFDLSTGERLGRRVADFVLEHRTRLTD